jgi:hypothetical protein
MAQREPVGVVGIAPWNAPAILDLFNNRMSPSRETPGRGLSLN